MGRVKYDFQTILDQAKKIKQNFDATYTPTERGQVVNPKGHRSLYNPNYRVPTLQEVWTSQLQRMTDDELRAQIKAARPDNPYAVGANPYAQQVGQAKGAMDAAAKRYAQMQAEYNKPHQSRQFAPATSEDEALWHIINDSLMQDYRDNQAAFGGKETAADYIGSRVRAGNLGIYTDYLDFYKDNYARYSGVDARKNSVDRGDVEKAAQVQAYAQKQYEDLLARGKAWEAENVAPAQAWQKAETERLRNDPLTEKEQFYQDYYYNNTLAGIDEKMAANEEAQKRTWGQDQGKNYLADAAMYERLRAAVAAGDISLDMLTDSQRALYNAYESGNGLEFSNARFAKENITPEAAQIENTVLGAKKVHMEVGQELAKASSLPDYARLSARDPEVNDSFYNFVNGYGKNRNYTFDVYGAVQQHNDYLEGIQYIEPSEVAYYNYLVKTQGLQAGKDFIQKSVPVFKLRRFMAVDGSAKQLAKDAGVLASVASLGTQVASAVAAPFNAVDALFNPNHSYLDAGYLPNLATQSIRGVRAESWGNEMAKWPILGEFGQGVGEYLYGLVMSGADMATAMAIGKGVQALGGSAAAMKGTVQAIMSSEAGGATMFNALQKGVDPQKAAVLGLGGAAIEWLTEKYSIEQLLKKPDLIRTYIAQNVITEATEEGASNILNTAWDTLIAGDQSEIMRAYRAALEETGNEQEAAKRVLLDRLGQLGLDVLGGGLMGAGMASFGAVPTAVSRQRSGKTINTNGTYQQLQDLAVEMPEGSNARKVAQEIAQRGGKVTNAQAGRLYSALMQTLDEKSAETVRRAQVVEVSRRLEELGEKGNFGAAAEAIQQLWMGQRLDGRQRRAIHATQYGRQVVNELLGQDNAWVEAATQRVREAQQENAQTAARARYLASKGFRAAENAEASKLVAEEAGTKYADAAFKTEYNAKAVVDGNEGEIVKVERFDGAAPVFAVQVGDSVREIALPDLQLDSYNMAVVANTMRGMSAQAANEMLGFYRASRGISGEAFAKGWQVAYNAGKNAYGMSYVNSNSAASMLPEAAREAAYKAGEAQYQDEKTEKTATEEAAPRKKGKVTFEKGVDLRTSKLNANQRAAIGAARLIAKVTGVEIRFFQSKVGKDGRYIGEQGQWKPGENVIRIDLNAGLMSKGGGAQYSLLRTASHELTHFIATNSKDMYRRLQEAVIDELTARGQTLEERIAHQRELNPGLSEEKLVEEVVAEACEMMLNNSEAIQRLAQKDKGLAAYIARWVEKFCDMIRKAFRGVSASSAEARLLAQVDAEGVLRYAERLQKLWDDALVDAVENGRTNGDSSDVDMKQSRLLSDSEYARLQANLNDAEYNNYQFTQRPNGGKMVSMGNLLVYTHPTGEPEYVLEIISSDEPDQIWVENKIQQTAMKLEEAGKSHVVQRKALQGFVGKGRARFRNRSGGMHAGGYSGGGTNRAAGANSGPVGGKVSYRGKNASRGGLKKNQTKLVQRNWNAFKDAYSDFLIKYVARTGRTLKANQCVGLLVNGDIYLAQRKNQGTLPDVLKVYTLVPGTDPANVSINNPFNNRAQAIAFYDNNKYTREIDSNLFQARDYASLSEREILAGADINAVKNAEQRQYLTEYQKSVRHLMNLNDRMLKYQQESFAAQDRDAQIQAKNRMDVVAGQIQRQEEKLSKMEARPSFQAALQLARQSLDDYLANTDAGQIAKDIQSTQDAYRKALLTKASEAKERLERTKERMRDTQSRSALRDRIKRKVHELNRLLLRESDTKHVPQELKAATAEFLKAFTNDTSVFAKGALDDLRYAYDKIREENVDEVGAISQLYDRDIATIMDVLRSTVDGKRLSELTQQETRDVLDMVEYFNHIIKNANSVLLDGRNANIGTLGKEAIDRADGEKRFRGADNPVANLLRSGMMTPAYFFKKLGGTMKKLYDDLKSGEMRWARLEQDARSFFVKTAEKYHYWDWAKAKGDELTMTTQEGHDITLTREQALGLYATWKRENSDNGQQAGHLSQGGFVYEDAMAQNKKTKEITVDTAKPNRMSDADMAKVTGWLTEEQKAYADEMVRYMSQDMAALGNEVSMTLFGIKKYGEKYYFPYQSSQNYIYTPLGSGAATNDQRLKHSSFTNRTVQFANNPIIASDFTTVWANHVNHMILYGSMCVPLENFNRVYNYKYKEIDEETGEVIGSAKSVKAALEGAYGKQALKYIETLMGDLNGGMRTQTDGVASWLTSKFKKNAVFASLSVVAQQPSAIVRAMALVDPKYFATGIAQHGSWAELMQYSGTAIIKDMGGFDTATGRTTRDWLIRKEPAGLKEKAKAFVDVKDGGYRDEALSYLPAKADQIAWTHLWRAVKAETAANNPGLTGEAFLEEAARRFDEVVSYTQVYDSVLAKSQIMRSKDGASKMVTAFMAEPTVAYNLLYDAFTNKGKADSVKRSRALAAYVATAVVNALLKSIVTAARDDEEKNYGEKYLGKLVENLISDVNPVNLVPYARDIWSIFQGYDVERADMSLISDLKVSLDKIMDEDATPDVIIKEIAATAGAFLGLPVKNVWRDVAAVGNAFYSATIPFSPEGAKYTILEALPFYDGRTSAYYGRLLDAYIAGNTSEQESLSIYLTTALNKSDKTVKTQTKTELGKRYKAGEVTDEAALDLLVDYFDMKEDDAYWQLKEWREKEAHEADEDYSFSRYEALNQALATGNPAAIKAAQKELTDNGYSAKEAESSTRTGIKKLYMEGKLDFPETRKMLAAYGGSEWANKDANDWYWLEQEYAYTKANQGNEEAPAWNKYRRLDAALESGKDLRGAIDELLKHGYEKGDISGRISEKYKQTYATLYKTDKRKALALQERLLDAYVMAGYDRNERIKHIQKYWKT